MARSPAPILVRTSTMLQLALMLTLCLVNNYMGVHGQDSLQLTVTTPLDDGYPDGTSWITLMELSSVSALEAGSPGYFWGAVPASAVETACGMIESGMQTIPATVTAYGATYDWNLQLVAVGGCDASYNSPVGVEMVFTDDTGRTNALVCDSNAPTIGCAMYNTGDDVENLYTQGSNYYGDYGNRRRLLDNCAGAGAVKGVVGSILSVAPCLTTGILAPFCALGVVGVNAEIGVAAQCAAEAASNCFKGDAYVITPTGQRKRMSEIAIGDKVGIWNTKLEFSDVYAMGHADANASSIFVQINLQSTEPPYELRMVELSPLHFAITRSASGASKDHSRGNVLHKYAKDVSINDQMWVWDERSGRFSLYTITGLDIVIERGLFNPFTLQGTIVVDDVVASVHSDWFLDEVFVMTKLTNLLPWVYQQCLAPARMLYFILGSKHYSRVYDLVDTYLDIPQFGTNFVVQLMLSTLASTVLFAYFCQLHFHKKGWAHHTIQ